MLPSYVLSLIGIKNFYLESIMNNNNDNRNIKKINNLSDKIIMSDISLLNNIKTINVVEIMEKILNEANELILLNKRCSDEKTNISYQLDRIKELMANQMILFFILMIAIIALIYRITKK